MPSKTKKYPLEYFLSQKQEYDTLKAYRNGLIAVCLASLVGASFVVVKNKSLAAGLFGVSAVSILASRVNGKRLDHLAEVLNRCSIYEVESRQDVFTSFLGGEVLEPEFETINGEIVNSIVPVDLRSLRFHHLMILAPTGFGKSTLVGYLLDNLPGETVIVDPHSTPRTWGDLPVVGMGRNYSEVEEFLGVLLKEMNSRYERRMAGDETYSTINVVVDEFPAIAKSIDPKKFKETVQTLLCEARKVNMKLILLSQGKSVKTIGLEGQSELLENLTVIRGGGFAESHARSLKNDALLDWVKLQERGATVNDDALLIPDLSNYNPRLDAKPGVELMRLLPTSKALAEPVQHFDVLDAEPPREPGVNQLEPPEPSWRNWEQITPLQKVELVQRIQLGQSQNEIMRDFFGVRKGANQRYKNAKTIYDEVKNGIET